MTEGWKFIATSLIHCQCNGEFLFSRCDMMGSQVTLTCRIHLSWAVSLNSDKADCGCHQESDPPNKLTSGYVVYSEKEISDQKGRTPTYFQKRGHKGVGDTSRGRRWSGVFMFNSLLCIALIECSISVSLAGNQTDNLICNRTGFHKWWTEVSFRDSKLTKSAHLKIISLQNVTGPKLESKPTYGKIVPQIHSVVFVSSCWQTCTFTKSQRGKDDLFDEGNGAKL